MGGERRGRAAVIRTMGLAEAALSAASAVVEDLAREAKRCPEIPGLKEAAAGTAEGEEAPGKEGEEEEEHEVEHTPDHDDVASLWWSFDPEALSPMRKRSGQKAESRFAALSPLKSMPSGSESPRWAPTRHGAYVKVEVDAAGAA
jgi:hypothetical protein